MSKNKYLIYIFWIVGVDEKKSLDGVSFTLNQKVNENCWIIIIDIIFWYYKHWIVNLSIFWLVNLNTFYNYHFNWHYLKV